MQSVTVLIKEVENVKKQSRFHPRCGTSFIFVILIISILISSVLVVVFPSIDDVMATKLDKIFEDLDEFENYIAGDFSDEELYEYISKELEITYQEENANNSNTISNNDDNKKEEIINTKDEESLVKKYNTTIIISVLGGISLFIFVIIIIFLVKNKKIKNQNKILQQNQEISSSQEQEEQNKTLEQ